MGLMTETNPSLWIGTTSPGDLEGELIGEATADVIVVGAGIAGLMTARLLAEAGKSVVVVEAGDICAGATGFSTAKITSLHGLNYAEIEQRYDTEHARIYGEANEAGIAEIERLIKADGIDCDFERKAHIAYTTDTQNVGAVQHEAEVATRLGLPAHLVDTTELPYAVLAAVQFDNQAQFHPRAFCLGLVSALRDGGNPVYTHSRVTDVDFGYHIVQTDNGIARGEHIVVATHLPIKEMGGYFAKGDPYRSYALAVKVDGPRPENMYISVDSTTRSLRTAGEHLIVGGEGHRVGDDLDTEGCYRRLEEWAREQFNVQSVDYRWSAQDWKGADGIPYIGRMAGHEDENMYVATAFKKWGIAHGAVAGMVIRDLIVGNENPWHDVYDASRLNPKQSAKGVLKEVVETAAHFIGDRLHTHDHTDIGPVCTHLGCRTLYNQAENSWDCPCHGSRFSALDGRVIEGPAVKDLPNI